MFIFCFCILKITTPIWLTGYCLKLVNTHKRAQYKNNLKKKLLICFPNTEHKLAGKLTTYMKLS